MNRFLLMSFTGFFLASIAIGSSYIGAVISCEVNGQGTLDGFTCVDPIKQGYCLIDDTWYKDNSVTFTNFTDDRI